MTRCNNDKDMLDTSHLRVSDIFHWSIKRVVWYSKHHTSIIQIPVPIHRYNTREKEVPCTGQVIHSPPAPSSRALSQPGKSFRSSVYCVETMARDSFHDKVRNAPKGS